MTKYTDIEIQAATSFLLGRIHSEVEMLLNQPT